MTLKGHTNWVPCVGFSPDGKRIASGSADRTIKIWDAGDGRELLTLKGHTRYYVESVAFSPDGRQIASGADDGTITIFPAADWKQP
jgi:WD40 repeat protein